MKSLSKKQVVFLMLVIQAWLCLSAYSLWMSKWNREDSWTGVFAVMAIFNSIGLLASFILGMIKFWDWLGK